METRPGAAALDKWLGLVEGGHRRRGAQPEEAPTSDAVCLCVTTETRPLDRLGQLGEVEQDSNTDSELESNTDSHRAQNKAHVARQSAAERGKEAPHSKAQSTVCVCIVIMSLRGEAEAYGGV